MFDTSRDVLNLIIAFSVFWLAIWLSWIFYQVGKGLKNMNNTLDSAKKVLEGIGKGVDQFRNKAGSTMASLAVLLKGGKEIYDKVQSKKTTSKPRKKTRKKSTQKKQK